MFTLIALAGSRSARASEPVSIYVVPRLVEQSTGAPGRVAIHGAFFRLNDTTMSTYGTPQCGVMYFQCAAGSETLCRMQWDELAAAAKVTPPTTCSGFGSLRVISTATLREEGAVLATPDPWDLGMGISVGMYVDGKCSPARALVCPPSGGADGGAAGGAPMLPGSGGAGAGGSTAGAGGSTGGSGGAAGGANGTGGATTIPGSGGATAATGGAPAPTDAGAAGGGGTLGQAGAGGKVTPGSPSPHRSGCTVGGAIPSCPSGVVATIMMALGALAGRPRFVRRRRN